MSKLYFKSNTRGVSWLTWFHWYWIVMDVGRCLALMKKKAQGLLSLWFLCGLLVSRGHLKKWSLWSCAEKHYELCEHVACLTGGCLEAIDCSCRESACFDLRKNALKTITALSLAAGWGSRHLKVCFKRVTSLNPVPAKNMKMEMLSPCLSAVEPSVCPQLILYFICFLQ